MSALSQLVKKTFKQFEPEIASAKKAHEEIERLYNERLKELGGDPYAAEEDKIANEYYHKSRNLRDELENLLSQQRNAPADVIEENDVLYLRNSPFLPSKGMEILKNPNTRDVISLAKDSPDNQLRVMKSHPDTYYWPAYDAEHDGVRKLLGLPREYTGLTDILTYDKGKFHPEYNKSYIEDAADHHGTTYEDERKDWMMRNFGLPSTATMLGSGLTDEFADGIMEEPQEFAGGGVVKAGKKLLSNSEKQLGELLEDLRNSLKGKQFYHEAPGDLSDSFNKEGIRSDYGTFFTAGKDSDFVTNYPKTSIKFSIPEEYLADVAPDMRYAGSSQEEDLMNLFSEHPDDLVGADLTFPDAIPRDWIESIELLVSPEQRIKKFASGGLVSNYPYQ